MKTHLLGLFALSLLTLTVSEDKYVDKIVANDLDKLFYSQELKKYSTNPFTKRHKRSIIGTDTRFQLNLNSYADIFPFSTVVHFSIGCSGTLITPKHVLTSASCFHSGVSLKRVSLR